MKTEKKMLLAGLLSGTFLLGACSTETREKYEAATEATGKDIRQTAESVGDKAGQARDKIARQTKKVASTVGSNLNQSKNDFVASVRWENRQLEKRIEELKEALSKKGNQAGVGIKREIADLEVKRKDLNIKLKDVENASGDAWQQLKQGVQEAVADLRQATDKAEDELKEKN